MYHVLVEEAERARRALIDAGLEIQRERQVVVTHVKNQPGSAAAVLRRVASANVNIDLLYVTVDGRLVLGGDDVPAIRRAVESITPPGPRGSTRDARCPASASDFIELGVGPGRGLSIASAMRLSLVARPGVVLRIEFLLGQRIPAGAPRDLSPLFDP